MELNESYVQLSLPYLDCYDLSQGEVMAVYYNLGACRFYIWKAKCRQQ